MKAVEFDANLDSSGQIAVPDDIAGQLPRGESVHIILQWDADDPDHAWISAGRQRFEAAYADEDAVYEQLADASPTR